ncbi:MAG: transposase [Nitrospirae bacterium]|nr:transposase [Nitrospirota bacterium]
MARPLRIQYPGACYHVTSRGNERKAVFSDARDRDDLLQRLSGLAEAGALRVYAWALLPNHFHRARTAARRRAKC